MPAMRRNMSGMKFSLLENGFLRLGLSIAPRCVVHCEGL